MGGVDFRRKLEAIHAEHKKLQSQVGPSKSEQENMSKVAGKTGAQRPVGKVK